MLAHPAAAAGVVAVELWRGNVVAIGGRWSLVGVIEGKGGHDAWRAKGMGQHEGGGHLVLLGHLVGEHIGTAGTMTALVIVIIDKNKGAIGGGKAPGGAPVGQIAQLILAAEHLANGIGVTEFGDGTQAGVLGLGDGLAAQIDDLLEDIRLGARAEAMISIQIVQTSIDGLQIAGPHMLGGIHTETGNAQIRQMVQEVNNLVTHPGIALVEIAQTNQLTVTYIGGIRIVGNGAGGIKVQRGEGHGREALGAGIGIAAASARGATIGSHVIEHHIHIGAYADIIATPHHIGELLLIAGASVQLVGDGLITLPPWPIANHSVLIDRRYLSGGGGLALKLMCWQWLSFGSPADRHSRRGPGSSHTRPQYRPISTRTDGPCRCVRSGSWWQTGHGPAPGGLDKPGP